MGLLDRKLRVGDGPLLLPDQRWPRRERRPQRRGASPGAASAATRAGSGQVSASDWRMELHASSFLSRTLIFVINASARLAVRFLLDLFELGVSGGKLGDELLPGAFVLRLLGELRDLLQAVAACGDVAARSP